MLHDEIAGDPRVDAEAALELWKEATKLATASELEDIGARLAAKSAAFRARLAPEVIGELDADGLAAITGRIFSLRRKAGHLIRENGLTAIRAELAALLHGPGPVGARLERFTSRIRGVEPAMVVALASETLHFVDPERHWLWTYWVWSPQRKNGALALVTHDTAALAAAQGDGAIYEAVGRATLLVDRLGHAAGYSRSGRGLFGTDVFLACVYAVYMYTVFRVKLSQEFNRILPELPELVERVLGVKAGGSGAQDGR